jgi:hypothetical protein
MQNQRIFKKNHLTQLFTYFSLFCVLFFSHLPSSTLSADTNLILDDECERRAQMSRILTGVTVVAIAGGIAYAVSQSGGHGHHHSSDSSSSSSSSSSSYSSSSQCYPSTSCYSYSSSDSSDYSSRSSSSYSSSSYDRSNYNSINKSNVSNFSRNDRRHRRTNPQYMERAKKGATIAHDSSSMANQLSGLFMSHFTTSGQGSFTAFVQLPDGSMRVLGSIPFSGNTSTSLPYGPFNQVGTYTFGISVDEGTVLPIQTKIGSIHLDVNGSTVQSHEFSLPSHPPANYELSPCSYTLF